MKYDRRTGQYRGDDGKFVPRQEVLRFVDREIQINQVRMKAHTRLLIDQKIDLAEWQNRMAQTLKDSHLRVSMLAAGGKEQTTKRHYGAVGNQLRKQYDYLNNFANDLYEGKLTPTKALKRAAMYAESVKITFSRSEQISRMDEGFNAAKRVLDSNARHCSECIDHQRTEWTSIEEITPVGTDCSCQNKCRCRIVWARIDPKLLNQGILAQS